MWTTSGLGAPDSAVWPAAPGGLLRNRRSNPGYSGLQAEAVRRGHSRPVVDLCIAATALANSCIVATLNTSDFEGIAGLRLERW